MSENVRGPLASPLLARWGPALSALVERSISAEQGRFLPWLPVFMAAGNICFFSAARMPPAWLGYVIAALAACGLPLAHGRRLMRAAALCLLAAALGFLAASLRTHALPPMPSLPRGAVIVTGRVAAVDPLPVGRRVLLSDVALQTGATATAAPIARRLRIRLRDTDRQAMLSGERLQLRALLRPPYAPSYPGGWDQRRDAFFQGLGGVGFALGPATLLTPPQLLGWGAWWQGVRQAIAARIAAAVPGAPGGVAATLLTGLNTAIPQADRNAFATAGLAHILAVAGLHIGIVMSTVFAATRCGLAHCSWVALRYPVKQIAGLAAIATGAFYMAVTGMHLPIIRSFVMAALVTLGLIAGRQAISMRSLGLAAAVLLLFQPEALAGVSFQMSFAAVLVLIAGYEVLHARRLPRLGHGEGVLAWFMRDLVMVAMTSLLAALATAPFVAYHFGQIELYSVAANMLAVPLAAFWVLPWGLAAYLLMPVHAAALALVPMGWGCWLLVWIARTAASLPAADVAVLSGPLWSLVLTGIALAWLCLWRSRMRLLGLPVIVCTVFILPFFTRAPDLLLSGDGRLMAIRTPAAVYVLSQTRDDFTLGAWQRFFGGLPVRPFGAAAPGIVCATAGCLLPEPRLRPPRLLYWRAVAPPGDCKGIGFIVTLRFWDDGPGAACAAVPYVDRGLLARGGAAAIYFATSPRIVSDRAGRGHWPWLPEPSQE